MYFQKHGPFFVLSLLALSRLAPTVTAQPSLSSPVEFLWNEIENTIGNDAFVTVDPLNQNTNPIVITIHCKDSGQARALASIIIPQHVFGSLTVNVTVLDPSGNVARPTEPTTQANVVDAYYSALFTNRLFVAALPVSTILVPNGVGVVYTRDVVQFFNDDLAELFGGYNAPAATVFNDVVRSSFAEGAVGVVIGTQPFGAFPPLAPGGIQPRSTGNPSARSSARSAVKPVVK